MTYVNLLTMVLKFDISKAFDKVLHKGLIYKLKQNGVVGNLLNTLTDFLKDRKQRVVLNGQNSTGFLKGFLKVQFWDHYFSQYI